MKDTQHTAILETMLKGDPKKWWRASDFAHPSIVGYEAGARWSELGKYKELFEPRPAGKYIERRIRWENMSVWWHTIPDSFKEIFRKHNTLSQRRDHYHCWEQETPACGIKTRHLRCCLCPAQAKATYEEVNGVMVERVVETY